MKNLAPGERATFHAQLTEKPSVVAVTAKCSKCGRGIAFRFTIDRYNFNQPQRCKTICECGQDYEFQLTGNTGR